MLLARAVNHTADAVPGGAPPSARGDLHAGAARGLTKKFAYEGELIDVRYRPVTGKSRAPAQLWASLTKPLVMLDGRHQSARRKKSGEAPQRHHQEQKRKEKKTLRPAARHHRVNIYPSAWVHNRARAGINTTPLLFPCSLDHSLKIPRKPFAGVYERPISG